MGNGPVRGHAARATPCALCGKRHRSAKARSRCQRELDERAADAGAAPPIGALARPLPDVMPAPSGAYVRVPVSPEVAGEVRAVLDAVATLADALSPLVSRAVAMRAASRRRRRRG